MSMKQTASDWQKVQVPKCEHRVANRLIPVAIPGKKRNETKARKRDWRSRQDSNLQPAE